METSRNWIEIMSRDLGHTTGQFWVKPGKGRLKKFRKAMEVPGPAQPLLQPGVMRASSHPRSRGGEEDKTQAPAEQPEAVPDSSGAAPTERAETLG